MMGEKSFGGIRRGRQWAEEAETGTQVTFEEMPPGWGEERWGPVGAECGAKGGV